MTTAQTGEHFAEFVGLTLPDETMSFGKSLTEEGFTAMRRFLDDFRAYLRTFRDSQAGTAHFLVAQARRAIPDPGRISPSWVTVWDEYEGIVTYKCEVLTRIPQDARAGEWQVLLDNPYTSGNIAVYPGLSFTEAAYMYAYFRTGLEPNEFIRLQRIDTVIMNTGKDAASEL